MKKTLTLCMFLVCAQASFAQINSSRVAISSGMPSRLSMNVTVARQQRSMQADSTAHNPLYEGAGSPGQNPMFENRFQPANPDPGPMLKRKDSMPAEKPYNGLRDVVKTQV
ncbi:hypothetical protein LL912_17940 [Niabella sp. CC-SYL272]|uniref:hypothetical protein n=1 Tax=Niabella agricola TaxID=2891571 RepID=UPI001F1D0668|nr:hypothetical protein [Niabella agricola]MCF3110670.1 hypothetical protein [Niabella agricola]